MPVSSIELVQIPAILQMKHCAGCAFYHCRVLSLKSLRAGFNISPDQILSGYLKIPFGTNIHSSCGMIHQRYVVQEAPVSETFIIILFETDVRDVLINVDLE
jgi:hypothetical protein